MHVKRVYIMHHKPSYDLSKKAKYSENVLTTSFVASCDLFRLVKLVMVLNSGKFLADLHHVRGKRDRHT